LRKIFRVGVALIALGAMLAVAPAAAEVKSYFDVKGGYFGPTEKFQNETLDGNTYWEIAGGFDWWFFGAELGVGYMQAHNSLVDVKGVPVLLSGKLQLPILFFVPYVKVGVGAYFFDAESRTGKGSDTDVAFGYQGGVGIDFRLGPVVLGIEGKYMAVEPSFNFGTVKMEGVAVTGNLGFRF
jgi:hypothetical protein